MPPRQSETERQLEDRVRDFVDVINHQEIEMAALRDLVAAMYLEFGRHGETTLTTEQKELLYDTVEGHDTFEGCEPMTRWWR
jgi:hypothetical protein